MRRFLVLIVLAAVVVLLLTRAEPLGPNVSLETPVDRIGRATPVRVLATDWGSGLAWVEVRLHPPGGTPAVLMREAYEPKSWRGSGIYSALLSGTVDAVAARVPEGAASLEIWAADHSWLSLFRRGPRLVRSVMVDVTPPTLAVVSEERVARQGGSESVVFRVGADAAESGVQVGHEYFPATAGLFTDSTLRAALFALPQDAPEARPMAVVVDTAGNRRTAGISMTLRPRIFADKTLPVTEEFLRQKVPELLEANGLDKDGGLLAGYLRVNRELRAASEKRLREICRRSLPTPRWQGAFVRLPNSAPLSGFADRRTYTYDGKEVDRQTHLGFDLASLRASPVPAANAGRVMFAGPLGIYGNTVVLDHGLGIFSLYGHLSEMSVAPGADVGRGDVVGKTGETGLAAGDHLHFSIMLHGVHVDPVEWWDAHWIQDHVESRLAAFPRAAVTAQ